MFSFTETITHLIGEVIPHTSLHFLLVTNGPPDSVVFDHLVQQLPAKLLDMTADEDLQASLERHNATFEALLNLIPAKYYLIQELSDEQVRFSPDITALKSLVFPLDCL